MMRRDRTDILRIRDSIPEIVALTKLHKLKPTYILGLWLIEYQVLIGGYLY